MQSVERTSLHVSSDWPSSGEDNSEVFLPEEDRTEIIRGHSRLSSSSLSSSSSSELQWTESEGEKEKAGGTRGDLLFAQKVRIHFLWGKNFLMTLDPCFYSCRVKMSNSIPN